MSYKVLRKMCSTYNKSVRGPEFIGAYFSKMNEKGIVLSLVSIRRITDMKLIDSHVEPYRKGFTTANMRDLTAEHLINKIIIHGLKGIIDESTEM